ncbi:protein SQS1 [Nematolebias whitei]|uniref:protein SQS1 n=1 Tax=Nematolebias whitei TaxID=451745 RepID=UPI0018971AC1|nr:protein SQS1 [Nematolebias whitei]
MQQNKILDPGVRLNRLVFPADVQQTEMIKEEAPEEWSFGVDQKDPETLIKEEEEELRTSLDVEQLSVKEETDDTRFSFTAFHLKSEDDEEKPLFSQLHQHQVEDGDLPTSSSADQMKAATGGEDCVQLCRLVFPADVQQTVLIKEAPEEWSSGVDQKDPETLNIKEEKEEMRISLDVEQLSVKEETDDTRFTFTAVPLKSEDDELTPLLSQLHRHQVEDGDLPTSSSSDQMSASSGGEDCGGADTTRNPYLHTNEDYSSSSETDVSENDDEDVNDPDTLIKESLDSGSEPEDGVKDWKESRTPESGVNTINKSCSFSECEKLFLHKESVQRNKTEKII